MIPQVSLRQVAFALEAAVNRALALSQGHGKAHPTPLTKADLRGRLCHCPPGLPVHLLHSEGVRESCDVVIDFDSNVAHPERPQLPPALLGDVLRDIAPGDAIHVKTDHVPLFVEQLLPRIAKPFVLVTGDSDMSPFPEFEGLLEEPRVAHWFAQNADSPKDHAKLTRLPIGLDNPVFTKLEKRLGFALTMLLRRTEFDPHLNRNDMGDQRLLQRVRSELHTPVAAKPARVLCTFHQNGKLVNNAADIPARVEAYRGAVDNPSCFLVPRRLRQEVCWRIHDRFAFELAPQGRGLDCFRTWEALFLRTIPIVKPSPLDALYRELELPVVVVESYDALTTANLTRWQQQLAPRFGADLDRKLSLDYWVNQIVREKKRAAVA